MHLETKAVAQSLSAYLKAGTSSVHERLDQRIMTLSPFASRGRFACFARMQLRLHYATAPLYSDPGLRRWLPSLADGDRLQAVLADCRDLDIGEEELARDNTAAATLPAPGKLAALGWVYTREGSSLGAAILLKHAREQLGLSEEFGARHLAGQPEGRRRYWTRVTGDMDALPLDDSQRAQVLAGARDAFDFVYQAVEELYADTSPAPNA